jgi:hypothetical protein
MKRHAVTIVEMLVVMVLLTAFMALGTMLLATTIKHFGRQRGSYDELRVNAHLAETLRRDAHAATNATTSAAGQFPQGTLTLAMPDGKTIEYVAAPRGIDRLVREGDRVASREFFRLTSLKSARFGANNEGEEKMVSCVWDGAWQGPTMEGDNAAVRAHRIEAALGREGADE